MSSAVGLSVSLVAYLLLFAGTGIIFLFANLFIGKFVRPNNPEPEKLEIYECGEPTIGSSFVQFDIRFYVVALLFIIFDVEVAFFFPWAAVFGKSTNAMKDNVPVVVRDAETKELALTPVGRSIYRELGVINPTVPASTPATLASVVPTSGEEEDVASARVHEGFRQLAWVTVVDIGAFFAILLIGFAYVWKRGDLDWVRAVGQERAAEREQIRNYDPLADEQFLSA